MSKVIIPNAPQFIIALEKKTAKPILKWLRGNVDDADWSLTACSFVANSQVPENYRAKTQYSALTFRDDGYACIFKLRFTDETMSFADYQAGIRKTMVAKRGYQMSDSPNIDIWFD